MFHVRASAVGANKHYTSVHKTDHKTRTCISRLPFSQYLMMFFRLGGLSRSGRSTLQSNRGNSRRFDRWRKETSEI